MSEVIFDSDIVSRIILDPKDFPGGVLDLRKSFQFSSDNQYRQSVNCHRLANNDQAAIHQLGLVKEAVDHAAGRTGRKYKGYCQAEVLPIRTINVSDQAHFEVYHKEENGNKAHCEIKVLFKQKNARNEAITQLIGCFSELVAYAA
ncbi:MAG: hypothetical protein SFX19_10235 [Alphaproteobacteria bacterium]|nr:hypothetical protein [Alphaproteobacteria bacterium]